jgi:hypothetical protein
MGRWITGKLGKPQLAASGMNMISSVSAASIADVGARITFQGDHMM